MHSNLNPYCPNGPPYIEVQIREILRTPSLTRNLFVLIKKECVCLIRYWAGQGCSIGPIHWILRLFLCSMLGHRRIAPLIPAVFQDYLWLFYRVG